MKRTFNILLLFSSLTFFLTGCPPREIIESNYTAVYIERPELEKAVRSIDPKPVIQGGKIAVINNYILLIDLYRGLHIIDNSDIYAPTPLKYLVIPGIKDVAIKDGIAYANSSIDLIAIDLSNLNDIKVIDRQRDYFKEPLPPDVSEDQRIDLLLNRPTDNSIILAWQLEGGNDEEFHF